MLKLFWLLFGSIFLVLGLIGLLLPVIPQIPFLLAAAFCFSRVSPALQEKIHGSRLYRMAVETLKGKEKSSKQEKEMK